MIINIWRLFLNFHWPMKWTEAEISEFENSKAKSVQGYQASWSLRADGKNSDELVISSNFQNSSLCRARKVQKKWPRWKIRFRNFQTNF